MRDPRQKLADSASTLLAAGFILTWELVSLGSYASSQPCEPRLDFLTCSTKQVSVRSFLLRTLTRFLTDISFLHNWGSPDSLLTELFLNSLGCQGHLLSLSDATGLPHVSLNCSPLRIWTSARIPEVTLCLFGWLPTVCYGQLPGHQL